MQKEAQGHICYKFENPETHDVWGSFQGQHSMSPAKPERNYLTLNHPFKARCTASNPTASYVNGLRGQMRISRWGEWAALDTSTETNISSLFQILLWGEGRQGTDPLTSFLLTTLLCLLGPPYSPGDRFFSIVLLYFSDHEIIFWESEEDYILSSLRNLTKISIQFRICFIFINTNPLNLHQVGCIP